MYSLCSAAGGKRNASIHLELGEVDLESVAPKLTLGCYCQLYHQLAAQLSNMNKSPRFCGLLAGSDNLEGVQAFST
jgi:hypothetical protein